MRRTQPVNSDQFPSLRTGPGPSKRAIEPSTSWKSHTVVRENVGNRSRQGTCRGNNYSTYVNTAQKVGAKSVRRTSSAPLCDAWWVIPKRREMLRQDTCCGFPRVGLGVVATRPTVGEPYCVRKPGH